MPSGSRLFVNDTIVSYAIQRGVARYFRHQVRGLVDAFGERVTVYSRDIDDCQPATLIRPLTFRGRRHVHQALASAALFKLGASVSYSPYFGKLRTSAAEVFTVHDLIYELYPEYFPRRDPDIRRFLADKKRCIEGAATLLAVSEHTAADLLRLYPNVDKSRIAVTPHGVDPIFFDSGSVASMVGSRPFLLYVGNRTLYKNFTRLLVAFGRSGLGRDYDLRVVSPGVGEFTAEENARIDECRLRATVTLLPAISDLDLRAQYAAATAFVCPSEYEGFGLPVLEAMASGTLVALANTSSLPEVGGTPAYYFDPVDVESIADCLTRVAALDSATRALRIADGIARARTFTWERSQAQTVAALQRLM